ncbi:hypothetical protein LIA77_06697 [Sarocladium implicatum]|nr:hypothetical protein LIA77_06697 [Sarocladium implicatum]
MDPTGHIPSEAHSAAIAKLGLENDGTGVDRMHAYAALLLHSCLMRPSRCTAPCCCNNRTACRCVARQTDRKPHSQQVPQLHLSPSGLDPRSPRRRLMAFRDY